MSRLIINASNIHVGGGKILLEDILENLSTRLNVTCFIYVDQRFSSKIPLSSNITIIKVKPRVISRINVDFQIKRRLKKNDKVLYFGNLPPLKKLGSNVVLFLQNKFVIENYPLSGFSLKSKIRLQSERIIFNLFKRNLSEIIVQTESMKHSLLKKITDNQKVFVIPFFTDSVHKVNNQISDNLNKFIYVSSGDPHKNHRNLIESWIVLASKNHFPELYLTLKKDNTSLSVWIQNMIHMHNLNIHFIGGIERESLLNFYSECSALIYPSFFESFGLPLIEAANRGLPIIASELDYVRDVVVPVETFNPNSPLSIARSVLRYSKESKTVQSIRDANFFIDALLN